MEVYSQALSPRLCLSLVVCVHLILEARAEIAGMYFQPVGRWSPLQETANRRSDEIIFVIMQSGSAECWLRTCKETKLSRLLIKNVPNCFLCGLFW